MERVITYIDGFNLYFGLKASRLQKYYWLNIQSLSQNLLKPNQQLMKTKYFTARVSRPPDKQKRQTTFIEALETLQDVEIYYGHYQQAPFDCRHCGKRVWISHEKMTDANIAVELLTDAFLDKFDVAMLISGDGDLAPPIEKIHALFQNKRVVSAFPPSRISKKLQQVAKAHFVIGRKKLARSQFPQTVQKADGFVLQRPASWK